MQVLPVSNSTLSSAVPVSGAAAVLLAKEGESAQSGVLAPVDEVSFTAAVRSVRSSSPDTYENLARQRNTRTQEAAASESQDKPEDQPVVPDDQDENSDPVRRQRERQQEEADLQLLRELKQRDQEVRAHEQAHVSVGGQYTGAASFTYQSGPDGVRYAVGGEVPIDVSKVANDSQATLEKMQVVQRAALAPAEPSAQDRQVAAQASQVAAQALAEIAQEQQAQRRAEQDARKQTQEETQAELDAARKEQKKADEKEQQEERVSAGERFAEYNARMRRINEFLLQISVPPPVSAGQILDDVV